MELEQTTQTQELTELVTEEGTIWNQQKAKQLGQYMETWGQERNQNYQAYQPGHSVAFYTIQVPDDLLSYEPKIQPAIGNNPIWLNWSETGSEGVIVWWQYTLTVRHKLPRSMSIYLL